MGCPDFDNEVSILKGRQGHNPLEDVVAVATKDDMKAMRNIVKEIYTDEKIYEYIAAIAVETRNNEMFKLGLSPRGSLALARASRAVAFLHGRNYVIPDDVAFIFRDVAEHRIVLSPKAKIAGLTAAELLDGVLKAVPVPTVKK